MMKKILEIKCLSEQEQKQLMDKIEKILAAKKKDKVLSEWEVREIEELKLKPLLDIQNVQSVYEDFMYKNIRRKKNRRFE